MAIGSGFPGAAAPASGTDGRFIHIKENDPGKTRGQV